MTPNAGWRLVALAALATACTNGGAPADSGADTRGDVPPACAGEDPSRVCRTSPNDCVPSACTCSEAGWACTADCGGGRSCGDGGSDADAGPGERCLSTGGTSQTALCCQATIDFPNNCLIGACGCAPENSHSVSVCACPTNTCFTPNRGCVAPACTPGMDQTCNDNPAISSLHGRCQTDHTCVCDVGPGVNPATGRCL